MWLHLQTLTPSGCSPVLYDLRIKLCGLKPLPLSLQCFLMCSEGCKVYTTVSSVFWIYFLASKHVQHAIHLVQWKLGIRHWNFLVSQTAKYLLGGAFSWPAPHMTSRCVIFLRPHNQCAAPAVAMGTGGPLGRKSPPAVLTAPFVQTTRLPMRLVSEHPAHRELLLLSLLLSQILQRMTNMWDNTWDEILPIFRKQWLFIIMNNPPIK